MLFAKVILAASKLNMAPETVADCRLLKEMHAPIDQVVTWLCALGVPVPDLAEMIGKAAEGVPRA